MCHQEDWTERGGARQLLHNDTFCNHLQESEPQQKAGTATKGSILTSFVVVLLWARWAVNGPSSTSVFSRHVGGFYVE